MVDQINQGAVEKQNHPPRTGKKAPPQPLGPYNRDPQSGENPEVDQIEDDATRKPRGTTRGTKKAKGAR